MNFLGERAGYLYAGAVSVRCSVAPAFGLVEGQVLLPKLAHGGAHHFAWAGNAATRPCPAGECHDFE